ncbi:isopenicillin N synthase-like dioxygenase [Kibdelosporangium banguiense]|uniref:Isopenicillin N synthase-like dioxygenase n=1 Tax=Kibdelosporangium banguiense TaxID=1365924 RepID=A0ABS4TFS7_9PSEU|nr:isopenicillin N synthase family oxygenase [Kibdelosporangium banguiense]MBP2323224.1 isopenicillin N synthase-like dioxygenase [Kibdelosporangium banguiense]
MTDLRTFGLPDYVEGTDSDVRLGHELVKTWRADGLFRISCDRWQARKVEDAFEASRRFFTLPDDIKTRCVSDLTYAGYSAADGVETFTICQDIPREDVRVGAQWPCHGPVPWPSIEYRRAMRTFLDELARIGERLLHLIAIGLELPDFETFTALAEDGWHHLLTQQIPANRSGDISSHGLLVITLHEGAVLVSPGEILEFLTGGALVATPLEVVVGEGEQQVMTYFHEPSFDSGMRPVVEPATGYIHYGSHFTGVFMRRYPDRMTTHRIAVEDRLSILASLSKRASVGA